MNKSRGIDSIGKLIALFDSVEFNGSGQWGDNFTECMRLVIRDAPWLNYSNFTNATYISNDTYI
jgi:hypothetical protein